MADFDISESTWTRASSDWWQLLQSPRFWVAEVIVTALLAFTSSEVSNEPAIQVSYVVGGIFLFAIMLLLTIWVATAPRNQRDDARSEVLRIGLQRDWHDLIDGLLALVIEGENCMEANGRPKYLNSTAGLAFMNNWVPRVLAFLPPEYRVDARQYGGAIFDHESGQGVVWRYQLDLMLSRLREISDDIREKYIYVPIS